LYLSLGHFVATGIAADASEIAAHTASIRHCGHSKDWHRALVLLEEFVSQQWGVALQNRGEDQWIFPLASWGFWVHTQRNIVFFGYRRSAVD